MFRHLAILLSLLTMTSAAGDSPCLVQDVTIQPNFDVNKYMGRWFEVKWIPNLPADQLEYWQDFSHQYTKHNDSAIAFTAYGRPTADVECERFDSWITLTDTPGKMVKENFDYWVISTDYTSYSLVYGCKQLNEDGTCDQAYSWLYSRTMTMSADNSRMVDQLIAELCLDQSKFLITTQTKDCGLDLISTKPPTSGAETGSLKRVVYGLVMCFALGIATGAI